MQKNVRLFLFLLTMLIVPALCQASTTVLTGVPSEKEKLARETGMKIYLYKQGVFWVAYEQSALLLGLKKDLKPSFRFIKAVGREVLSIGLPNVT